MQFLNVYVGTFVFCARRNQRIFANKLHNLLFISLLLKWNLVPKKYFSEIFPSAIYMKIKITMTLLFIKFSPVQLTYIFHCIQYYRLNRFLGHNTFYLTFFQPLYLKNYWINECQSSLYSTDPLFFQSLSICTLAFKAKTNETSRKIDARWKTSLKWVGLETKNYSYSISTTKEGRNKMYL